MKSKAGEGLEFVHYAFHNIQGVVKGDEAILMLSMHYDEFMNMVSYNQQLLREFPMAPMRQWDMETHGAFSKERERMRIFAKLRIAEHIPGLTWEQFCRMTPEETEWAMEFAQEEMAEKAKADQRTRQGLEDLKKGLGGGKPPPKGS